MAAELKSTFGADSELIAGGGGIFEISVDDELVFSKRASNRFPDDGEVVGLIRDRQR